MYFEHVKSLNFDDRPDYDYLKRLFRELFFRKGFTYDNLFDWEIKSAKGEAHDNNGQQDLDNLGTEGYDENRKHNGADLILNDFGEGKINDPVMNPRDLLYLSNMIPSNEQSQMSNSKVSKGEVLDLFLISITSTAESS
jgi:hypothetical protein